MTNITNTKNITSVVATPAASTNLSTSTPGTLTVVVLDSKSQPTPGAQVSITPSNASGKTNSIGEIQFKLGTSLKYNITASYGSNTVTVPYYVTKDGATRLVVNPVYVKTVEAKEHPLSVINSDMVMNIGIGVGIAIVLFILWKLFSGKSRRRK